MDLRTPASPTVEEEATMTSATAVSTSALSATLDQQINTAQPMWKIVLSQFMEHRMAVVSSVVIGIFILVALSAPLISSWTGLNPSKQNVNARYLTPFSHAEAPADFKETRIETWSRLNEQKALELGQALVSAGVSLSLTDAIYEVGTLPVAEAKEKLALLTGLTETQQLALASFKEELGQFSTFHVFGTDEIGRDVLIRLIYGSRVSMGVGVMVALASAMIGLLIGSLAGYYGGAIDTLLMRITDSLLSLPLMPVLIVISAIDLNKLPGIKALMNPESESIIKMFFILCLFSWMTVARLVRGSILSLREREFVLAARTLGAKDSTIIIRHMFPNVMAPMLVSITLGVGESILFEAALSFLGLGIMPPTASWGNMLTNAQEVIYKNAWLTVLPGLMIFTTTVCFNFIGDGLQNAVDPKSVKR